MAMCYQKLGQLEECALCLEKCLSRLNYKKYQSLKDKSISQRINKLKFECRLHLQLCAIYSQLHRHKDAYEQAQEGVRISHFIVRDQLAICHFFQRKADFEQEANPVSAGGKGAPTNTTDKSSSKRLTNTNRNKHSQRQTHKGLLNAKVLDEKAHIESDEMKVTPYGKEPEPESP